VVTDGVSVIIPSYEAWPFLQRTLLAAIAECQRAVSDWEIIVVDNESGFETTAALEAATQSLDGVRLMRREGLDGIHFAPGAARNQGIEEARHDCLVFLDADCIPASGLVERYHQAVSANRATVFVGHRVFIDAAGLSAFDVAADRPLLDRAPVVASTSNYGLTSERRLPELIDYEDHTNPWDCMYACNFALHRDCLGEHRFNPVFDGYWGYEDVELGYRLHRSGRRFAYLPEAFVYHQEGGSLSAAERSSGRGRNFLVADRLIPGFRDMRERSPRPGSWPADARTWGARREALTEQSEEA